MNELAWQVVAQALLVVVAVTCVGLIVAEVVWYRRHPLPPLTTAPVSVEVLEQVMECPACSAEMTIHACQVCGGDGFVAITSAPAGSST